MDKIEEIIKIIEKKSNEIQNFKDRAALMGPLSDLIESLEGLKKIKNVATNTGIDSSNLENFMSNLAASHQDERSRKEYTISPLLEKLPIRPYSKTTSYFGGGIGDTIQIDRGPNKPQSTMTSNEVFTSMYPGKISYRYGISNRIRIPCGPYYDDFVSHLKGLHELSELPISSFNDKDVFEIKKIKGIPLKPLTDRYHGNIPLCPRCLSINVAGGANREQCNHIRDEEETIETIQNISSAPILKSIENTDKRQISDSKSFSFPLNEIFEKPQFLENTQILTIATGFTRQASFGRAPNTFHTSVNVTYDPYVGYKMDTNGLMFKIKDIPENFIAEIINEKFIVRDILINVLAEKVETIIQEYGRSIFELELWLSGIIKTLKLDSIDDSFNFDEVLDYLSSTDFREVFQQNIFQEITYYSHRPNIQPNLITTFSEEIGSLKITIEDLISKIKNILKTSLSYSIYMSGLIISGSTTRDLDFIYAKESNEVVIFDSVSYGNGASKLINNYLIGENNNISQEQGLKPKYFQETLFELLQPCSQGTADRIFFQNLHNVFSNFTKNDLITYRLDELIDQQNSASNEFNQIKLSKIQNMVPLSIGKRSLQTPSGTNNVENKKIQEIAHICVHGCPECILLNSYSGPSIPRLERFHVSKYLIDLYFKFITKRIRVGPDETLTNIEKIIDQFGMVIISQKMNDIKQNFDSSLKRVNSLIGEKFNGKLIKFSGIWFDCPISANPEIEISILMSVIK
ncbi:MAG: hypothetical protein J4F36_07165 [Nitrosopumilaceae archaeon]|nr:hypothetical protein [Nitrosopumilaceae archaeon]